MVVSRPSLVASLALPGHMAACCAPTWLITVVWCDGGAIRVLLEQFKFVYNLGAV